MRPETGEWVAKAEADFTALKTSDDDNTSMVREAAVTECPNHDLVCFLAQQSSEKYLKALLCEEGIPFPKTHDLNKLATLLPASQPFPPRFVTPLARLDRYSVEFRYPGSSATPELAAESARDADEFRTWARGSLAPEA